ncbi:tRNA-binding protein [Hoyosella subflava]|uniref:CsaA protein n=1 Tax=Hoyosella subflava (strain DSM 45089 / JCM 17490 / NBRC 109087 / DQS3-9A1) TaxID=443218 RepID=F6EPR9_HOYSD|nr:tRNA-binding protein [Hoyosella subflava]AEF40548.1 CsaA protein [Hoyosella subflava DQS3-9A1]
MTLDQLGTIELRVGTILTVEKNLKARKPAYILTVDLGPLGQKTSSAQITDRYEPDDLVGRQVVCVCNLEPKRVAGVKSEVLTVGVYTADNTVTLVSVDHPVANGAPLA